MKAIVGAFFNDHASLRRYLVDEGFLDREAGTYWRAVVWTCEPCVTRALGRGRVAAAAERGLPIGGCAHSRPR